MKLNISYPTVRIVYDRRKKASSVTPGAIDVEINHNGKRKWISTGVRILPKQWSPELLVVRHADCANLRMKVETVKKNALDFIQLCMIKGEEFSFQLLTEAMNRSKFDGNLIDFIRMRIEERTDLSPGTRRNHCKIVSALEEFGKVRVHIDRFQYAIADGCTPGLFRGQSYFDEGVNFFRRQGAICTDFSSLYKTVSLFLETKICPKKRILPMQGQVSSDYEQALSDRSRFSLR